MKITRSQLHSIIKEELENVMDKDRDLPDTDYELYGQLLALTKELQGFKDNLDYAMGRTASSFKTSKLKDKTFKAIQSAIFGLNDARIKFAQEIGEDPAPELAMVREDGHTDVPSAVRKLKTAIEDAEQILRGLAGTDGDLPAWWMSKATLASDYLDSIRDYFLVDGEVMQEKEQYVKSFYKAKEKRAEELKKKGVDPDLAFAIADDQMEKAGKKKKKKSKKS